MSKLQHSYQALKCGHAYYAHRDALKLIGEKAWCKECKNDQEVVLGVCDYPFHVRCVECRYSRKFGMSEYRAEQAALRHASERRHEVLIRFDGKVHSVIKYTPDPSFADIPPF